MSILSSLSIYQPVSQWNATMNDKLSEKVIGAAFKVHNTLGFGQ